MRIAAALSSAILLFGLAAAPRPASAGATVDLLFVGWNGTPIAPTRSVSVVGEPAPGIHAGDTLTMAVLMTNDERLRGAYFSLNYDLEGADHLDIVSAFQWRGLPINQTGTIRFAPSDGFIAQTRTFVGSFQGQSTHFQERTLPPSGSAHSGGYQMGTVTWRVNGGTHGESTEILSGILNLGNDIFADPNWSEMNDRVLFNAATLNFVPEPSSAALLGLGLLGLVLAKRRLG